MAAAQVVQSLRRHFDIIQDNEDNADVLTENFMAVASLIPRYWEEALKLKATKELKESMKRFHWCWIELPEFPLRRLVPTAAKALQMHPKNRGLVTILADLFEDVCKQVMPNKQEALKAGVLAGFLEAVLQVVVVGPAGFSLLRQEEAELIEGCLRAAEMVSITPTNGFYDTPLKVKNEFFALGKAAWSDTERLSALLERVPWPTEFPSREGVNEPLQLLAFLLSYLPGLSIGTKHCVQLLKNLSEGWEATLPVKDNPAFLEFLRRRISDLHKELSDEKQRWSREGIVIGMVDLVLFQQRILLLEEIRLLVDRTLDPSLRDTTIPYKHTEIFLHEGLTANFRETSNHPTVITHKYLTDTNNERGIARRRSHELAKKLKKKQKAPQTCARCNVEWRNLDPDVERYKKCGQCARVHYCGPECQKLDWPEHKKECRKEAALSPRAASTETD
ncbi:hypothetical protein KFL_000420220 [Klebsormidium nitens]|uniref:MYND-type domain-containing protein n=1 Tax=Klebsormidium nitens TaxID=105231 RepID=A0A1Y1HSI4_KLENI|nr:hypothetical protein KFL_000420220 [Klebsormidium nitens]|eukprot:GAQ79951.1 hypothetical protein KFL_000420220 [Klebsormidium nitens]